jgi:hypothetical protein
VSRRKLAELAGAPEGHWRPDLVTNEEATEAYSGAAKDEDATFVDATLYDTARCPCGEIFDPLAWARESIAEARKILENERREEE